MFIIVQLAFEDFTTEFNQNCIYDAVVIYGDSEEAHELGGSHSVL